MQVVYKFVSYPPKLGQKLLKLLGESDKTLEESFTFGMTGEELNRRLSLRISNIYNIADNSSLV